jgi:hypothetical protein
VFNSGTIDWADGLQDDAHVQKITENIVNELCSTHPGLNLKVDQLKKRWFSTTILGSQELDVSDIDVDTLRLSGAATTSQFGRWSFPSESQVDVNRDGFVDLVAEFHFREKDLEPVGDEMCLEGYIAEKAFKICNAMDLGARIRSRLGRPGY